MKKITLLMMMAICSVGFSQQEVVQDFENSPAIDGFEGLTSATIVADPSTAGNGQVFELVTNTGGQPWQGGQVDLASDSVLDLTTDITVKVDVWSDVAFSPMLKVESSEGAPAAANTQSHDGSGWKTLTFTLNTGSDGTATANGTYTRVVFFPNRKSDDSGWGDPIVDGTFYFDNITGVKTALGGGTTDTPPTVAAPTPDELPAQVISLFSDAYTNIPVDSWSASWDDSDVEDIVVADDNVKKITFTNFLGIDFATQPFDASEMTHFHMDYWTNETDLVGKVLNPKWSNHQNGSGETNAYDLTNPIPDGSSGQWVSVEVPLSDFALVNGGDKSAFAQFILSSNLNVVYVDNIYLFNPTLSVSDFDSNQFSAFPNPTLDNWTIKASNYSIQNVEIFNTLGKLVKSVKANNTEVSINASELSSGIYFAKVYNENNQNNTIKLIKK